MATHKHSIALALIASIILPAATIAAGQPQVRVQDSIAGLETPALLQGMPANTDADFHLLTPSGDDVTLPVRTDGAGSANVRILSGLTEEAGRYGAYATVGDAQATAQTQFSVLPDRISDTESSMDASSTVLRVGTGEATVWVTLRDRFGNALEGRPVELISSRPSDRIDSGSRETDAGGTQEFRLSATEPGTVQLRAMDMLSGLTLARGLTLSAEDARGEGGDSPARTPLPARTTSASPSPYAAQLSGGDESDESDDGAVEFRISVSPENPQVGDWLDMQVTALRDDASRAQGYTRNPTISAPNDPDAELPAFNILDFIKQEDGRDRCLQCLSFGTPGEQTLVVEDKLPDGTIIRGELTVTVTASAEFEQSRKIEILSHRDGDKIGSANIVLEGIGPKLANLKVTGGIKDVNTDTDTKGFFSAQVALDPSYNEYTVRVQSVEDGGGPSQYDSGPLHLVRDNQGPELEFRFDPEEPLTEQDASLTVRSEPGLGDVKALIGNRELSLSEDPDQKGTYKVLFQAPAAGSYQPSISATDDAGNRTEVRTTLKVLPRDLPKVTNLRAAAVDKNTIGLGWDPVPNEEITSYIVLVGTDSSLSLSSLETPGAGTATEVKGLDPGTEYFFAVVAKQGDRQGKERSDTVSEITPGLSLRATGKINGLLLEWRNTDKTRLKHYLVEYGSSPDAYTEQREVKAKDDSSRVPQAFLLDDLLGAQTYHVRLTPVKEDGEFMLDLTTKASGTTLAADGHTPVAPGTIPFDLTDGQSGPPLPDEYHSGAPSTPGSGLPFGVMAGVAAASVVVFALRRRLASRRETQAFLQAMQTRYHG